MATKTKYFLVKTNEEDNINEFDSREEVVEYLQDNDELKEELNDNSPYNDHSFRLFKGVEVTIEAELEGVKVKLTDCAC